MEATVAVQRPNMVHSVLTKKYLPEFYLHPKEQYYPCDTEWFVQNSRLVDSADNDKTIVPQGQLTMQKLAEAYPPTMKLRLEVDPAKLTGQLSPTGTAQDNDAVPVFARCRKVTYAPGKTGFDITYMVLYAYNGEYNVLGRKVGAHIGDWEHMTVRCDAAGELLQVYYGAHRHGDGTWVPASKVPRHPTTQRIQAFVAVNGHGLYPGPGTQWRLLGLANDCTSRDGFRWRPKRCVLVRLSTDGDESESESAALPMKLPEGQATIVQVHTARTLAEAPAEEETTPESPTVQEVVSPEWIAFGGKWGTSSSPAAQAWWTLEHLTGNPVLRRCLCPCVRP